MSKQEATKADIAANMIFADAHEAYSHPGMEDVFDELMYNTKNWGNTTLTGEDWVCEGEKGFSEPDLIVLHGGPDEEEERQRFEAFEDFMQFVENEPDVLLTESYMDMVLESPYLSEHEINSISMQPESTVDEVDLAVDSSQPGERIVAFSNDYHVPRMDDLYDRVLRGQDSDHLERSYLPWPSPTALFDNRDSESERNDYLIVGADRFENEENYAGKWWSEAIRDYLPQGAKDLGKKYLK